METRSGRAASVHAAPLLILLLFAGEAAAQVSLEQAYRSARTTLDKGLQTEASRQVDAALARVTNPDDQWAAALRILKAEILARGRPLDARPLLAPELPPALRNTEAAVWRLIALGYVSEPARRRTLLEEAHKLATASQPQLLHRTHFALGMVLPGAEGEKHLFKALELARREGNRLGITAVYSAFLRRFTDEKRYREAIDAGEPALRTFVELGAVSRIQNTAGNLGWAYLELGDWDRALEFFKQAEAAAAREKLDSSRVRWLNHIGNVHLAERRVAEAERYYTTALQLARTLKDEQLPEVLTNLANAALESGRYPEARKFLAEALSLNAVDPGIRTTDARLAMLTGDSTRAERTLRDVVQNEKAVERRWIAEGYLAQLLARMQRNEEAEKHFKHAIETVRSTRDKIDQSLRLSFFNVSADVFNSYITFLVRNNRHQDALAATETIRAQSLEEGLNMKAAARKLDARAIARQEGTTILSYWLDRDQSHLWAISANGVVHHRLPPASAIEREVAAYRRDLAGRNGSLERSGARGQTLYRMLVEPAGVARDSRVIIVADGVLHALNFETLVVPGSRPHYWIEDAVISSASSLQLLAQDEPKKPAGASMLLVGDPPVADAAFPKLAFAAQEIRTVGRHFGQRVVLDGPKATPAAYRAAEPERFAFVHFVAHGVSSRLRPLESAVILGRDTSKQYKLYARDIVARPLDARLVTISSCYGAGERTFAGEGLVGLAWAFLRAGASQVIAALWEVNDSATPKLMDLMYGGIRAGRDPAVALRDAKLALVKGKGAYQLPRYWAPFVLYSGN